MNTPVPTGRIERVDGRLVLSLTRTFEAPIDDVWAAVTEPERLARWLGTWQGDPTTGRVSWRMLFEGETDFHDMVIRECDPPRRLAVTSLVGDQEWFLEVDLAEHGGVTTLRFSQPGVDAEEAVSVGPGWEYYLDCLVAVETGRDVAALDFERGYYPAMADYYRAQRDGTSSSPPS
jgi:uncharacterized protein YndB with AHSA1/START domain